MINSLPGVCGGKPCIAGTRIRVQDIIIRTELGDLPDDLVRAYPHISLADVHLALAHYYEHQAQIDQDIREGDEFIAKMKFAAGVGLLAGVKG